MKTTCGIVILSIAFLTAPLCAFATTHTADSAAEVTDICRSVQPGDTIVLANGTYTDQEFVFTGDGIEYQPIILRAETPGRVILTGASKLLIDGEYLGVEGLLFKDGALESGSIVRFGNEARHCMLQNTAIINYNAEEIDTRYFWVTLRGFANIIQYCTFSGQTHSGVTVCVQLDGKPARHIISRNHFAGRPEGNGNGFESIRIGTGGQRMTNARCTVSKNLFENCNGEIETVSNKSCENAYSYNTFLNCTGTLTIRQGNRCAVKNNVFIGGGKDGAGGLRVTGQDHRIEDNYFSGMTRSVISLQAGVPGAPKGGYAQVKKSTFDGNIFVDNPGPLFNLDAAYSAENRPLLPEDVTISNSLMMIPDDAKPMIESQSPQNGITWKNNTVVSDKKDIDLPFGFQSVSDVPDAWKERLTPCPRTPDDVGAVWMRDSM